MHAHAAGLYYVSNNDHGEALAAEVADLARHSGNFDQQSMLASLFSDGGPANARFWREIGEGVVAGRDPRDRCACGALATCWVGNLRQCSKCNTDSLGGFPF